MSPALTLSPEMVSDVLSRLPVKSLLRFRSISKPVCSIIDGPDFAKLHLNQTLNSSSNNNKSLLLTNCPLHSIDLRSLERAVEIDHPLKSPDRHTQVLGSCNGLLCLYKSDSQIVLWNSSTRDTHLLPYIPIIYPNPSDTHFSHHQVTFGFGYDPLHDDYKLLRITRFHASLDSEVMLYSLKSDSWKRVAGFPYGVRHWMNVGLFTEGALHWLINHPESLHCLIVAFDLATEEFRQVPHPTDGPCTKGYEQFGVLEGRICVTRYHAHARKQIDVWMMKHYGVKESWAKLVSTSLRRLTGSSNCFMPLCYLSNGDALLLLQDYERFLRYDLKTKKVKNVRIQGVPVLFDATPYVESLVKPFPMASGVTGRTKKNAANRDGYFSKGFKLVL